MESQTIGRRRGFQEAFGFLNDHHDWLLENQPLYPALPADDNEGL